MKTVRASYYIRGRDSLNTSHEEEIRLYGDDSMCTYSKEGPYGGNGDTHSYSKAHYSLWLTNYITQHILRLEITHMTELTLELTNDTAAVSGKTPVDQYVESLLADAKAGFRKYQWEMIPTDTPSSPAFKIFNAEEGITSELHRTTTNDSIKYMLTATNAKDGSVVYSAVEWFSVGHDDSVLGELYILRTNYIMEQEDLALGLSTSIDGVDPKDDAALTNDFIDALIQDFEGKRRSIYFERRGEGFVVDSFGISESVITLTKEWEDTVSAHFFIKVEKPDGTLVLSCGETSKHDDDEAEVRKLYRLLDEKLPIVTTDDASVDVRRFIEGKAFDAFFERVIEYAIPSTATVEKKPENGAVLIHDIFESVSEAATIRQLLGEIRLRKGPLSEPEYKRLKSLAQSVFTIARNTRRAPNGSVFTGRVIPVAYDSSGLASRRVKFAASISHIVNAYTTWHVDVFGQDPAMNEGCVMTKTAVLILAAILADQL